MRKHGKVHSNIKDTSASSPSLKVSSTTKHSSTVSASTTEASNTIQPIVKLSVLALAEEIKSTFVVHDMVVDDSETVISSDDKNSADIVNQQVTARVRVNNSEKKAELIALSETGNLKAPSENKTIENILNAILQEITSMKMEINSIKSEVVDLRSELRSEVADLRSEFRSEVADVKSEVVDLRLEMREIGSSVSFLTPIVLDIAIDAYNLWTKTQVADSVQ